MDKRIVIGIHISNRVNEVPCVQEVLTKYGCNIKTRLGLHEASESACSTSGLILLEMCGTENDVKMMEQELSVLDGVSVQKMVFKD